MSGRQSGRLVIGDRIYMLSAGVTQPLDTDNPLGGLWAVNIEGPLYHGSFEPLAALLDSFLGTDGPVPQLVIGTPEDTVAAFSMPNPIGFGMRAAVGSGIYYVLQSNKAESLEDTEGAVNPMNVRLAPATEVAGGGKEWSFSLKKNSNGSIFLAEAIFDGVETEGFELDFGGRLAVSFGQDGLAVEVRDDEERQEN